MSPRALPVAAWVSVLLSVSTVVLADEGFWPLETFASQAPAAQAGMVPHAGLLERIKASVLSINGCTGTVVSPQGLVVTSAACVQSCLYRHAAARKTQARFAPACSHKGLRRGIPLFERFYCEPMERAAERTGAQVGFVAADRAGEIRCDGFNVTSLLDVKDESARFTRLLDNEPPENYLEAARTEVRRVKAECGDPATQSCEVISLYGGADRHVVRSRRHLDVRLVLVSEQPISWFGGSDFHDAFPTYRLPLAFLRLYQDGQPLSTPQHIRWSERGVAEGESAYYAGHPSSSLRHVSATELRVAREQRMLVQPLLAEYRGVLTQFLEQREDKDSSRRQITDGWAAELRNASTVLQALSPELIERRALEKKGLGELLGQDAKHTKNERLRAAYHDLERYNVATAGRLVQRELQNYLEIITIARGTLLQYAQTLVRGAYERTRPSEERLGGYSDDALPARERFLTAPSLIEPDLEIMKLGFCLRKMRENLGPWDPLVKRALEGRDPMDQARYLVENTSLSDVAKRRALWSGGLRAIEASVDPLIAFARATEPEGRSARKRLDELLNAPHAWKAAIVARGRVELLGPSAYPEAAGTLRLGTGRVQGFAEGGRTIAPMTSFAGLYGHATERAPYAVPERWVQARSRVDLSMPLTFATTHDTLGELGAPLLNKEGELVGMTIGGNRGMVSSLYAYEPERTRAVALHSAAILEALEQIYGAQQLLQELRPAEAMR
jgi:hypothetical protein